MANQVDGNPAVFLQTEVKRLAEFVAKDLHEQIHKAYPNLDIDTCAAQIYAIAHRHLISANRNFADLVIDKVAELVAISDPM